MKNFTLLIVGILTLLVANEANARTLSCGQFKYTNVLTIGIDLDSRIFKVAVHAPNQILGAGEIGAFKQHGNSVTIPLYENSEFVGVLNAIPAGQRDSIGKSTLVYKGKNYSGFVGLFCHFSDR